MIEEYIEENKIDILTFIPSLNKVNNNELWNSKLDNIKLVMELEDVILKFSENNHHMTKRLFQEIYSNFNFYLKNFIETGQSETYICYGKNNMLIKNMIHNLADELQLQPEFNNKKIVHVVFNALLHSTEDFILNKLIEYFELPESKNLKTYEALKEHITNMKKKKSVNNYYIIYFQNIDHLFLKKKQTLFYSLLELFNDSINIILIGMTNNYNLTDMMEKRVRSRFNHNMINVYIKEEDHIYDMINAAIVTKEDTLYSELNIFRLVLLDNKDFNQKIDLFYEIGLSGVDLIVRIKYILASILLELKKRISIFKIKWGKKDDLLIIPISYEEIKIIVDIKIKNYIKTLEVSSEELLIKGNFFLLDFPKIHIVTLISLYIAKKKHQYKIILNMIYSEYLDYCKKYNQNFKIDLLQMKKRLEELRNSNIISIKTNEKLTEVYELKLPLDELKTILNKIYNDSNRNLNFDSDMYKWLIEFN